MLVSDSGMAVMMGFKIVSPSRKMKGAWFLRVINGVRPRAANAVVRGNGTC